MPMVGRKLPGQTESVPLVKDPQTEFVPMVERNPYGQTVIHANGQRNP
ncbi:unnamed protein product [Ixodes pacificus]